MGLRIGALYVRRSGFIQATPSRIWQEFSSFELLEHWFGIGHGLEQYHPSLGGIVTLSVKIDGQSRHFGGEIVAFEPDRELSFENNWHGSQAWPLPTFITLRLTAIYSGTSVELFHHGFERLGSKAADYLQDYEAGWSNHHIQALRQIVEN